MVERMSDPHSEAAAWGRSLRFWTRVTVVYLMVITVTGAAVRLTGSGLGCTDWPTCETNTELDAPSFHAAIEFGNRVVSGLAILPVVAAWIAATRGDRRDLRPWLAAIVAGFVGQVLLGMLVTRTELDPRIVLGHFLLSIVLIFLGVLVDRRARLGRSTLPGSEQPIALSLLAVTSVVVVLGTLVTGSGPHTGSDESGEAIPRLGFGVREITRMHSLAALLLVAVIVVGAWQLWRHDVRSRRLELIAGLALLQGFIGYLQYFTGVPALLVGLHITGSVLLFAAVAAYAEPAIGRRRIAAPARSDSPELVP